jgi:hypothetical protein
VGGELRGKGRELKVKGKGQVGRENLVLGIDVLRKFR